jgi:hypothetical protein
MLYGSYEAVGLNHCKYFYHGSHTEGEGSVQLDLHVETNLGQMLDIAIMIFCFTKQATLMRRSAVLNLSL